MIDRNEWREALAFQWPGHRFAEYIPRAAGLLVNHAFTVQLERQHLIFQFA
jgi:hypothetical protein